MPKASPDRKPALEGEPLELLEFICKREAARAESSNGEVTYVIMLLSHAAGCLRWQRRYLHPKCFEKQFPLTIPFTFDFETRSVAQNAQIFQHVWTEDRRAPTENERLQHAFNHPDFPLRDVQKSGNQLCFFCQKPFKSNPYSFIRSEHRNNRGRPDWKDKPIHKR